MADFYPNPNGGGGGGGAPTNVSYVTLGNDATLTAERVLTGTANQITVTDNGAGNTVVLSLPQSIATTSVVQFGGVSIGASAPAGVAFNILQPAASSGTPNIAQVIGGAHTTIAAGVEAIDWNFNLNRTVQFATGAITNQRAIYISAPTYAFVGASVITTAATLAISGAPTAGTNATITTAYALLVENGLVGFGGSINLNSINPNITVNGANSQLIINTNVNAGSATSDCIINTIATRTAGNLLSVRNNTVNRFVVVYHGGITVTQGVASTGTATLLTMTEGAHTTQTAGTEINSVRFDLSATKQWSTGGITNQRAVRIQAPTYSFVGASTITNAATLYVDSAPVAGANATITNNYALWIDAGTSRFDGPLDLSNISAGSTNLIITGTSDTPTVVWSVAGTNPPSTAPSGYIEISVGGATRYIPYWA
jgi:hypothetical protein